MRQYIFALVLLISACSETEIKTSNPTQISINEMSDILSELHLMEAHITTHRFNQKTISDSMYYFTNKILLNFNISEDEFNSALEYYSSKPKVIDSIYHIISKKLEAIDLELPDIDEDTYKITDLNKNQISKIINKTPYVNSLYNSDSTFRFLLEYKDSIFNFLKQNDSLLNNINLHSFMFSYNNICQNPNQIKSLLKEFSKNKNL